MLQALQRFQQQLGADGGQPVEQLAGGFVFPDFHRFPQQHIPGVQSLVHQHGGDAGLLFPIDDAPLDRRRSPVFGKQASMDVNASLWRQSQDFLWQNFAVRHHHNKLRPQLL